ncbi:MAG: phytanoyl-CoA dioxygenase family protein [Gammaproteobacteria bacterium]|nr:phytanoyl-CoA dioxygenase family protein [Gammaproteobacteria bacterium]
MNEQSATLSEFFEESREKALSLSNRGPLVVGESGEIDSAIVNAYWEYGFFVLEKVISTSELNDLNIETQELLGRAPESSDAVTDASGDPLTFDESQRKLFRFARPLSDPYGQTDVGGGRYQVKISESAAPVGSPKEVLLQIGGLLQFMDSALGLYGHPKLLALAEAINGPDFTPFTETMWIKQPRLGAAVSWHQDGTTHWTNPALDPGTHGFNFMVNLQETTPANALWVVPGTHKHGKADLKQMMRDAKFERIGGAVPLLCKPGDVAICNRQVVHGSFPNSSSDPRYTFVFGFHRRSSVLGVQGWAERPFNEEFIARSCELIDVAIAARRQKYPQERSYRYKPSKELARDLRSKMWTSADLVNYQRYAIGI